MTPDLITLTAPTSPAAEAYRQLRVNLAAAGRSAPLQTLLVVAAAADSDKATVVANLAVTFARVGKQVIIADCDLRRPAQHTIWGLTNAAGVTTALDSPDPLPLQATTVPGLRVLTSGPTPAVPADVVAGPAMNVLIGRLREQADIVLFDAPPLLQATDAVELATQVDGVLLTLRAGSTTRDEAQRARDVLVRVGARLLGATLVNVAAR